MTTAREAAIALRKIADSLDKEPDAKLPKLWLSLYCDTKESFLNAVRVMPRPLKKTVEECINPRMKLQHKSPAMDIWATVPQSLTCTLVTPAQPAVYECDPILSLAEEADIELGETEVSR